MEDQQSDTRDLTGAVGDETEEADNTEPVTDTTDSGAAGSADGKSPTPAVEPDWWTPRRLSVALIAAVVLFVDAGAFAGAALQPYLVDRARIATKLTVARTATQAISTLWTYTPEDMDGLPDRAAKYLSGDLMVEYRKYIDQIAPMNKQAKITDSTEITGAAVESLDGPEATVIVYTNTTATTGQPQDLPKLKYQSYRLTMRRDHNRWLVTRMPTITSLSLTPQL